MTTKDTGGSAFPSEAEMRAADVPWMETPDELAAYISNLVEREHDYGTCCYAMSMAAVAAFQYVAKKLGVTGFQASCADMDVLRRTRHYPGPFMVINGANALYPQYNLAEKLADFEAGMQPWLVEQAAARLTESHEHVHPNVLAHWRKLAARNTEPQS